MTSTRPYLEVLQDRFQTELRFEYVSEINREEIRTREFKNLYVKHAFDCLGEGYMKLYESQVDLVKHLKKQYKERYGA